MSDDERDVFAAVEIRAGRCPFGKIADGQSMAHCPLGFPGCGCWDEVMLNPHLKDFMESAGRLEV